MSTLCRRRAWIPAAAGHPTPIVTAMATDTSSGAHEPITPAVSARTSATTAATMMRAYFMAGFLRGRGRAVWCVPVSA